jgi:SAM-dependent methyltransferase/uncharacterized protein YbaR (Trm112 family)
VVENIRWDASFPFRLVCPRCRKPGPDGQLIVSILIPSTDAGENPSLQCPLCRTSYPLIDSIPSIPPDMEYFQRTQAWTLACDWIRKSYSEAEAACRLAGQLDPFGDGFREAANMTRHALAHYPEGAGVFSGELESNKLLLEQIHDWLARHYHPADTGLRMALEAGCGPGAGMRTIEHLFPDGVLGLDWRISVLQLARHVTLHGEAFLPFCTEGRRFTPVRITAPPAESPSRIRFLQGDILSPPLEAETFPAVIALSLLDCLPDPLFALGQLDALLAPGGLLLLGTPYCWDPKITPPQAWWPEPGSDIVRAALSGRLPELPHLRYELLEESSRVAWTIPGHDRLVYRYFLDLVLARKIPQ